jgi:Na+-driven multidrug efflux pump
MAAVFTGGLVLGGRALYGVMGGEGATLAAALAYSQVVFGGAIAYWLFNTLASVVRGTGVMGLPAVVMAAGAVLYTVLAPALILGWGPFPRLGVAGAALANVTSVSIGAVVLGVYLASGRGLVRPALPGWQLRWPAFHEILRVGAPGALNTVMTNLAIAIVTALVAPFGVAALAGYGMGARLEYMQIPLVFGMGSALVTMVGTNVGAGQHARALRVAWTGAGLAAGFTGCIGLLAALSPASWIGLFTRDPAVLAAGATYLRIVGPAYGFSGLGLALYFASQGAGRLGWPLVAGALRLVIAGAGGAAAGHALGFGPTGIYVAMALALVAFGATVALAIRAGAWTPRDRPR